MLSVSSDEPVEMLSGDNVPVYRPKTDKSPSEQNDLVNPDYKRIVQEVNGKEHFPRLKDVALEDVQMMSSAELARSAEGWHKSTRGSQCHHPPSQSPGKPHHRPITL